MGWSETAPEGTGAVRDRWDSLNALVTLADTVAARPGGATLVDLVRELEERAEAQSAPTVDGVTLASIHAAKGLEWPVVYVVGASEGLLPISMAQTPAEVEEERRLFYVALTRARDLLTVSWSGARTPGARSSRKPSRFLDAILDRPKPTKGGEANRRTGRRSARIHQECRACSGSLATPREQRIGRHDGCPPTHSEQTLEALKAWRKEVASAHGAPAYTVFTDATLDAIVERDPVGRQALLAVPGVGPAKLERFADDVLEILAAHRTDETAGQK